jgi:hypothetical protein
MYTPRKDAYATMVQDMYQPNILSFIEMVNPRQVQHQVSVLGIYTIV